MSSFRLLHLSDFHIALREKVVGINEWRYLPRSWLGLDRVAEWFGWSAPRQTGQPTYPFGERGLQHPSSHDFELAKAAARFAYEQKLAGLDGVLITGDLATTGRAADLSCALRYVDEPAIKPWLAKPLFPYWFSPSGAPTLQAAVPNRARLLLMPGNHDRFQGLHFHPGGMQFDKTFQRYWDRAERVQTLHAFRKRGQVLAVVAADFCLRNRAGADNGIGKSKWSSLGQGRAYTNLVRELIKETNYWKRPYAKRPTAAVVWALHFPPAFQGVDPALTFLNENWLLREAWRVGVKYIFSGHTHSPREYRVRNSAGVGEVTVFCAGTALQYCAPPPNENTVHRATIDVNGGNVTGVTWETWKWNAEDRAFVPFSLPPAPIVYRP